MVCVPVIKANLSDGNQHIYKIETQGIHKKSYCSFLSTIVLLAKPVLCSRNHEWCVPIINAVVLLDGNQLFYKNGTQGIHI